jgi:acetoin utilization deacetylase AcuC-like enzyme
LTTLLVTDPVFFEHLVLPGHPERPDRLLAIGKALSAPAFDALSRVNKAPHADMSQLMLAHDEFYVNEIHAATPTEGFARIDADTTLSPMSFAAAAHAAGAVCLAVDEVVGGQVKNAFCAVRPPGHHAEGDRAMGFCLFNNAVIGARHAQKAHGIGRVAIVDWDVHHGNGTQAIVETDPSIFYASTHQMPLYPGTGSPMETGVGNILNVPLAAGAGSDEFAEAFTSLILPALEEFSPELIVISAGFDAHWRDPLAEINLKESDFAQATRSLMDIADRHSGGRIVSTLEGGYDLQGLAASAAAHVKALMGA